MHGIPVRLEFAARKAGPIDAPAQQVCIRRRRLCPPTSIRDRPRNCARAFGSDVELEASVYPGNAATAVATFADLTDRTLDGRARAAATALDVIVRRDPHGAAFDQRAFRRRAADIESD